MGFQSVKWCHAKDGKDAFTLRSGKVWNGLKAWVERWLKKRRIYDGGKKIESIPKNKKKEKIKTKRKNKKREDKK